METQVNRALAVKEQGLKFNYCSSCHKFRQVYCYLESKAVCIDCTRCRQIALIDPPPESLQKPKRVMTRHKNHEPLNQLKTKVIQCLRQKSFSSKELYSMVGQKHYQSYDSFVWFLRELYKKGDIISRRWLATGPNYHALPGREDLISKRIGQEPEHRIIKLLEEVRSMPVSKIGRKIGLSRASAYGICKRIGEKSGKVRLDRVSNGQVVASIVDSVNSQ